MPRRKVPIAHANHERWLVSYADLLTLLFAFFVVMYASSQADRSRTLQLSEAMREAFKKPMIASLLGGAINRKDANALMKGAGGAEQAAAKQSEDGILAELVPSLHFLESELNKEIAAGKMQVRLDARGLVISLREAAFFPSGEDTLLANTFPILQKVSDSIQKLPNPVRLEGHTDSVPIHNSRFRSNWELSAARSIAMLELFTGRFKLPHQRFAVAGYADTVPVASNDDDQGRARNRRVDIVILNKAGMAAEPERH